MQRNCLQTQLSELWISDSTRAAATDSVMEKLQDCLLTESISTTNLCAALGFEIEKLKLKDTTNVLFLSTWGQQKQHWHIITFKLC